MYYVIIIQRIWHSNKVNLNALFLHPVLILYRYISYVIIKLLSMPDFFALCQFYIYMYIIIHYNDNKVVKQHIMSKHVT